MGKTKSNTKATTKDNSSLTSAASRSKAIQKKPKVSQKEKSTEFTKSVKMFRNQKEYFALDDDLKKW